MDRKMGKRMRAARDMADITAEEMGRIVERSATAVYGYERGENEPPGAVLLKWAEGTGRTIEWLIYGDQEKPILEVQNEQHPHPGIEALSHPDNTSVRTAIGIPDDLVAAARRWLLYGPKGEPWIIETIEEAIDLLKPMRGRLRRPATHGR